MSEIQVAQNLEFLEQSRRVEHYVEGGRRAMSFVREVLTGKKVRGERYELDDRFLEAVNLRVLWYAHPDVRGQLRPTDDYGTEVDTEAVVSGREAQIRLPLFGRWLSEQVQTIPDNPNDLLGAVSIAAAAHYGLTGPQLHPFVDGNGRTARILVNAILMVGTKEFMEHGLAVPPIPMLRTAKTEKGRPDPYVVALRMVGKGRTLNPLEVFIAQKWVDNLSIRIQKIQTAISRPTKTDRELIDQFKHRRDALMEFIRAESHGHGQDHPVPHYFEPRYIT